MAPVNPSDSPSGPPPAPVLGQGTFAAPVRAPAPANGQGSMAAPPARAPSQAPVRGGLAAQARGGSYPRPTPRCLAHLNPRFPFNTSTAHSVLNTGNNNAQDSDSDSDSDDEDTSTIRIKIFTPINVRGDSNLIAMDTSITATQITRGVVDALRNMSYGVGDDQGVPMIDADGHPRPIKVTVSAPLTVLGSKNLMGERAVMERIAPGLMDRPAATMTKAPLTELDGPVPVKKRERGEIEEEPVEGGSKRTRRD
ncbi:hypothetical protein DL95DRAFT_10256 [Leptodontidium sp. 2 PMI_412]|nr:hypothetical protein DL95DRAFT_10256 [Leptodontidium sp. 2 PMI_412]